MQIYLAGPFGFSEAGRHFQGTVLLPALQRLGHEVVDPWKLTDPHLIEQTTSMPYGPAKREAWSRLNVEIGRQNAFAIARCEVVVAILDGTDVDSGTASEIGFAFAKGKIIYGYRGDFRLSADNEGSLVNLQVEFFIRESGGEISSLLKLLGPA